MLTLYCCRFCLCPISTQRQIRSLSRVFLWKSHVSIDILWDDGTSVGNNNNQTLVCFFCHWSLTLALLPYCQEPDVDHQLSAHQSPLARQRQLAGVRLDGRWTELRAERKWIEGQHASQWEATATAAIPQERTSVSALWLPCTFCDVHVPTCTYTCPWIYTSCTQCRVHCFLFLLPTRLPITCGSSAEHVRTRT